MTPHEKLLSVTRSAERAAPGSEAQKALYAYANKILLALVNANLR